MFLMREVPLDSGSGDVHTARVQGYLNHKKHPPPRTLQKPYASGPMMILGGWVFPVNEIPPYSGSGDVHTPRVQGYLAHKNPPP